MTPSMRAGSTRRGSKRRGPLVDTNGSSPHDIPLRRSARLRGEVDRERQNADEDASGTVGDVPTTHNPRASQSRKRIRFGGDSDGRERQRASTDEMGHSGDEARSEGDIVLKSEVISDEDRMSEDSLNDHDTVADDPDSMDPSGQVGHDNPRSRHSRSPPTAPLTDGVNDNVGDHDPMARIVDLERQLAARTATLDAVGAWVDARTTELREAREQLTARTDKLVDVQRQLAEVRCELVARTDKLADAERRLVSGAAEKGRLYTQLTEHMAQVEQAEHEIGTLRDEAAARDDELGDVRRYLSARDEELDDSRDQLARAQVELDAAERELDTSASQQRCLRAHLDVAKHNAERYEAENSSLRSRFEQRTAEVIDLKHSLGQLEIATGRSRSMGAANPSAPGVSSDNGPLTCNCLPRREWNIDLHGSGPSVSAVSDRMPPTIHESPSAVKVEGWGAAPDAARDRDSDQVPLSDLTRMQRLDRTVRLWQRAMPSAVQQPQRQGICPLHQHPPPSSTRDSDQGTTPSWFNALNPQLPLPLHPLPGVSSAAPSSLAAARNAWRPGPSSSPTLATWHTAQTGDTPHSRAGHDEMGSSASHRRWRDEQTRAPPHAWPPVTGPAYPPHSHSYVQSSPDRDTRGRPTFRHERPTSIHSGSDSAPERDESPSSRGYLRGSVHGPDSKDTSYTANSDRDCDPTSPPSATLDAGASRDTTPQYIPYVPHL